MVELYSLKFHISHPISMNQNRYTSFASQLYERFCCQWFRYLSTVYEIIYIEFITDFS